METTPGDSTPATAPTTSAMASARPALERQRNQAGLGIAITIFSLLLGLAIGLTGAMAALAGRPAGVER